MAESNGRVVIDGTFAAANMEDRAREYARQRETILKAEAAAKEAAEAAAAEAEAEAPAE